MICSGYATNLKVKHVKGAQWLDIIVRLVEEEFREDEFQPPPPPLGTVL